MIRAIIEKVAIRNIVKLNYKQKKDNLNMITVLLQNLNLIKDKKKLNPNIWIFRPMIKIELKNFVLKFQAMITFYFTIS